MRPDRRQLVREEQGLADGGDLGLEALLVRTAFQKVTKSGGMKTPLRIWAPADLNLVICGV